jgi:uncharacterized protein YndB with AHSA1/START domain
MWKWIVGGLLVVVVLLAGLGYYGYTKVAKFASGGDSTSVMIAGTPERVFAALANADSLPVWMNTDSRLEMSHHGLLVVGDTVHVESTRPNRREQFTWMVTDLVPGRLLVRNVLSDTSGRIVATRRDSLVATGDSTQVISTIASPLMDSIRTLKGDTVGRVGNAVLDFSSKMLISVFRAASAEELVRLKSHIEGKPVPPARP